MNKSTAVYMPRWQVPMIMTDRTASSMHKWNGSEVSLVNILESILEPYNSIHCTLLEVYMPQVSLYIDKETLSKIEQLAQQNRISLSKWLGNNLKRLIKDDYPEDIFNLFGAVTYNSIVRPESPDFGNDGKRELI